MANLIEEKWLEFEKRFLDRPEVTPSVQFAMRLGWHKGAYAFLTVMGENDISIEQLEEMSAYLETEITRKRPH